MKGNNELILNEATMIEAMQEYLDKRLPLHSPKVTSVKGKQAGYDLTFTVLVEERKRVPPEPGSVT